MNRRFLIPASRELEEAYRWYERQERGLGTQLLDDVEAALASISHPLQGLAEARAAFDRIFLGRFPYSLVFAIRGDELIILAVAHQRRRPSYWSRRLHRIEPA